MKVRKDVTITLDHNYLLMLARYGLTVALQSLDGILDYNLPGDEKGTVVFADGKSDILYVWRVYVMPSNPLIALVTASVEGMPGVNPVQFVIVVEINEDEHIIKQVFEAPNNSWPIFDIRTMSVTFGFGTE